MCEESKYLNTDLDLVADFDLQPLAVELNALGLHPLFVTPGGDGAWYVTLETDQDYHEPEVNISAMLEIIAALGEQSQHDWIACKKREFNVGYDCGKEPACFNQRLTCDTLRRMAAVGASLGVSLYPSKRVD